MGIFEGHIRVHDGDRFALVASRWNDFIVERLIDGAKDCILRHGGNEDQVDLIRVPGSFELPQAAKLAAQSGRYAGEGHMAEAVAQERKPPQHQEHAQH